MKLEDEDEITTNVADKNAWMLMNAFLASGIFE